MPGRTFAENEQFWRETLSDRKKTSVFRSGIMRSMGLFLGILTLLAFIITLWRHDTFVFLGWFLVFDAIALLGLYGFFGVYLPYMYRLGLRLRHGGKPRPGHPIHRNRQR